MATTFNIVVAGADAVYARQAAAAAFDELNLVENHLSRFVESSDISRINRLARGESTVVALDTFRCLQIALDLRRKTDGAFDVAYATTPQPGRNGSIELSDRGCRVRVLAGGVQLDLGGIGKGFGLDRMTALLREWEIESALLQASTSTLLALGPAADEPGWPIDFGPEHDRRRVMLNSAAFSASGKSVKGNHIIDPRTGRPANGPIRCWSGAPTAAVADALSTAFMVMSEEEIHTYSRRHPDAFTHLLRSEGSPLLSIGPAKAMKDEE